MTTATQTRRDEQLEKEKAGPKRGYKNCQVHGPSLAVVSEFTKLNKATGKEEKQFSARCIECQREATRRSRLKRTSHPNTPPGSYFNGLRTLHGENITKRQVPFVEHVWQWLKDPDNQSRFNSTASLLTNKVLEIGISSLDPTFQVKLT